MNMYLIEASVLLLFHNRKYPFWLFIKFSLHEPIAHFVSNIPPSPPPSGIERSSSFNQNTSSFNYHKISAPCLAKSGIDEESSTFFNLVVPVALEGLPVVIQCPAGVAAHTQDQSNYLTSFLTTQSSHSTRNALSKKMQTANRFQCNPRASPVLLI